MASSAQHDAEAVALVMRMGGAALGPIRCLVGARLHALACWADQKDWSHRRTAFFAVVGTLVALFSLWLLHEYADEVEERLRKMETPKHWEPWCAFYSMLGDVALAAVRTVRNGEPSRPLIVAGPLLAFDAFMTMYNNAPLLHDAPAASSAVPRGPEAA